MGVIPSYNFCWPPLIKVCRCPSSLLPVNVNIAASAFYCLIFFAMNEKHLAVVIGVPIWK